MKRSTLITLTAAAATLAPLLPFSSSLAGAAAQPADPAQREQLARGALKDQVREAIKRSLPFLEKGGVEWMDTKHCMSCHTFAFTIWAHQEARQQGFAVEQEKFDKWLGRARAEAPGKRLWYKLDEPAFKTLQKDGIPEPIQDKLKTLKVKAFPTDKAYADQLAKLLSAEEMKRHKAQLLKGATREEKIDAGDQDICAPLILAGATEYAKGLDKDWIQSLVTSVTLAQKPDGFWVAGGQLPRLKRSKEEIAEVTTMWTILALASQLNNKEATASRERALAWLKKVKAKPGRSNESLILHMLVQHKLGDAEQAKSWLKELLAQQHQDGGWSWVRGAERSDAFATGQSLYALRLVGLSASDPAIQRAREYLVQTQQIDGSWSVVPDGFNDAPNPSRLKRTAVIWTYWGSTWATIGLLRTLPD